MVIQYPDTLVSPGIVSGDTEQTNEGHFEQPEEGDDVTQVCRYEPSSSIKEIKTSDGSVVFSQGVIYMPVNAIEVPQGAMIEVPGRVKAVALYFRKDQLNCKLYV